MASRSKALAIHLTINLGRGGRVESGSPTRKAFKRRRLSLDRAIEQAEKEAFPVVRISPQPSPS